jgi:hypothetical protein
MSEAIKLRFEDAGPRTSGDAVAVAEYQGFRVLILHDESPSNPLDDGGCEPSLAVASYGYGGGADVTEYGGGDILAPLARFTDMQLRRLQRPICEALALDHAKVQAEAVDNKRLDGGDLDSIKREIFAEALADMPARRQFEAAAALYGMIGIEALASVSRGYSQGDYADVLAVATPEWAAKVGAPRKSHAGQLAAAVELYGFWAWGDVYGFVIEDKAGEHIDSVWGFYSDNITGAGFEESGMADYVLPALQSVVEDARRDLAAEMEAERPDMYAPA